MSSKYGFMLTLIIEREVIFSDLFESQSRPFIKGSVVMIAACPYTSISNRLMIKKIYVFAAGQ